MIRARLGVLLAALCVLSCACCAQKITVDPNENRSLEPVESHEIDPRLAQKVTYEAWNAPLKTILADLSESTGVTLYSGFSLQDWQVRDRRMNVYVKDVPLAQLMSSIARVMKFKWSVNNDPTPPTYRLISDRKLLAQLQAEATRRQNAFKAEQMKRRAGLADALAKVAEMSDSQIAALEQSNPYLYLCGTTGVAKLTTQLLAEDPRIRQAYLNADKNALIQTETFGQSTQELCAKALQGYAQYDRAKSLPADLDSLFNYQFNITMMAEPDELSQQRQLTDFGGLAAYILRDNNGYHRIGGLRDPYDESTQTWAKAIMSTSDERGKRLGEYYESITNLSATQRTEDIAYYLMYDPVIKHSDESELQKDVDVAVTDEVQKSVIKQIEASGDVAADRLWYQAVLRLAADVSGLNIVSDSFGVVLDEQKVLPFKGTLQALVDRVGETFLCNWEKHGPVIEICRRDWFKRRSSQIPEEWTKPWRIELEKSGILSMVNHAQMIALTNDQIEENIATDDLLGKATGPRWDYNNQRGFLRFYLHLTDHQRKLIFTEDGLDPHQLNPDQWRYYTEMFNYGQRYAWNTEEFCDPDAGSVSISGKFDNVSPDGSHFYVVTVVLTKPDASTRKDIWGITLHKVENYSK